MHTTTGLILCGALLMLVGVQGLPMKTATRHAHLLNIVARQANPLTDPNNTCFTEEERENYLKVLKGNEAGLGFIGVSDCMEEKLDEIPTVFESDDEEGKGEDDDAGEVACWASSVFANALFECIKKSIAKNGK